MTPQERLRAVRELVDTARQITVWSVACPVCGQRGEGPEDGHVRNSHEIVCLDPSPTHLVHQERRVLADALIEEALRAIAVVAAGGEQ